MSLPSWFSQWLMRHPVKTLPEDDQRELTSRVMARLNESSEPAASPQSMLTTWWTTSRLMVATVSAMAVVTLVIGVVRYTYVPKFARTNGTLVLAKAKSDDAAWVNETLQLLDQLDQDSTIQDPSGETSNDEEWMKELELLETSGPSKSS